MPDASNALIIFTDGEDHDSFPEDAAKKAVEASIRIVSVGFGSEDGSRITLVDPDTGARSFLTDKRFCIYWIIRRWK